MIVTRTPLRITLGGGGTDIPSYYRHAGGMVISMAIDKYVYITLKPDSFDQLYKLHYSQIETTGDVRDIQNTRMREALKSHDLQPVEIHSCADLPSKSGLGSSGSFLVGLLKAIREYKKLDNSPDAIAEEACQIEIERLNEPVGKQDQYIAAYGGVRKFEYSTEGTVKTTLLNIDYHTLIQNMHVYSLNVYRNASDVLASQQKTHGASQILDTILKYCHQTLELLTNSQFDEYGCLLDVYWTEKRRLSNMVSLPSVDELYANTKKRFGVLGGKIIGAGGGGFLLLYANQKHAELERYMSDLGLRRLQYTADFTGSSVWNIR